MLKKIMTGCIALIMTMGILSGCNDNEVIDIIDGTVDQKITDMVEDFLIEAYGEGSIVDTSYNRYSMGDMGGLHTYEFKFRDTDGNIISAWYQSPYPYELTEADLPKLTLEKTESIPLKIINDSGELTVVIAEEPEETTETTPPPPKLELPEGIDIIADTQKELERYKALYPDKSEIVDIESPTITEAESEKEGYKKYVIDFYDLYPATLKIELPERLSVRLYNEGERLYADLRSMPPFYSSAVCICDENGNNIGGISANTIAIDSRTSDINFGTIYQGLMFSGMWDQTDYTEVRRTETESAVTTYVCYPDYEVKDRYPHDYERLGNTDKGDRYFYNKGILSYNIDKLKYVAVEVDYDCISDEELAEVAESVRIS